MPFGLSNAPANFQGYINKTFAVKLDIFVIVYLDNIFIYTKDLGQPHVEYVHWVLEQLWNHGLYSNLKKCRFHQDEVRFLGFVVSAQGIKMKEKRIEIVKTWPEPQSVKEIQVFLGFANFYRRFIKRFSKIAAQLTFMLKTTSDSIKELRDASNESGGGGVEIGGVELTEVKNSRVLAKSKKSVKAKRSDLTKAKRSKIAKVEKLAQSKKPDFAKSKADEASGTEFLTPEARLVFTWLQNTFTEAPILHHFDLERHIRIETDTSGYVIGGVLSEITSDQLSSDHVTSEKKKISLSPKLVNGTQWPFSPERLFLLRLRYTTHDKELLVIVEEFKIWQPYLESCKYEVLILIDHNNLRRFMDTKSLSSRQVRWT